MNRRQLQVIDLFYIVKPWRVTACWRLLPLPVAQLADIKFSNFCRGYGNVELWHSFGTYLYDSICLLVDSILSKDVFGTSSEPVSCRLKKSNSCFLVWSRFLPLKIDLWLRCPDKTKVTTIFGLLMAHWRINHRFYWEGPMFPFSLINSIGLTLILWRFEFVLIAP